MEKEKNMCLIKFSSIEESFMALAIIHNKEIMGRYKFYILII